MIGKSYQNFQKLPHGQRSAISIEVDRERTIHTYTWEPPGELEFLRELYVNDARRMGISTVLSVPAIDHSL